MYKLILFGALCCFAACKDKGKPAAQDSNVSQKPGTLSEDEMDFVDGCVANAAASIGEEKAFVLCKCILMQVEKENPGLDSAALAKTVSDTAKIARLAKNCK